VRIEVDYGLCQGHGVCESECSEVFRVSKESNQVEVLNDSPPEELRPQVEAAVKFCPTLALTLKET